MAWGTTPGVRICAAAGLPVGGPAAGAGAGAVAAGRSVARAPAFLRDDAGPLPVGLLEVAGAVLVEAALHRLAVVEDQPPVHDLPGVDLDRRGVTPRGAVGAVAPEGGRVLRRLRLEGGPVLGAAEPVGRPLPGGGVRGVPFHRAG